MPSEAPTADSHRESVLQRLLSALVDDLDALPLRVFEVLFTCAFLLRLAACRTLPRPQTGA